MFFLRRSWRDNPLHRAGRVGEAAGRAAQPGQRRQKPPEERQLPQLPLSAGGFQTLRQSRTDEPEPRF